MAKQPLNLDAAGRAAHVAMTQGRTATFLQTLSDDETSQVAELCDAAGVLVPDAPARFAAILAAYEERLDQHKASVAGLVDREFQQAAEFVRAGTWTIDRAVSVARTVAPEDWDEAAYRAALEAATDAPSP